MARLPLVTQVLLPYYKHASGECLPEAQHLQHRQHRKTPRPHHPERGSLFPRVHGVIIDTTLLSTGTGYGQTPALIPRGVIFNIVTRDAPYYNHAAGSKAPMTIGKVPAFI